jgi:hypothetical protein
LHGNGQAAMIHFGLDPGQFVHFLSGKYTGQYWDVCHTLDAVQDRVTLDDYNHIKRTLWMNTLLN